MATRRVNEAQAELDAALAKRDRVQEEHEVYLSQELFDERDLARRDLLWQRACASGISETGRAQLESAANDGGGDESDEGWLWDPEVLGVDGWTRAEDGHWRPPAKPDPECGRE